MKRDFIEGQLLIIDLPSSLLPAGCEMQANGLLCLLGLLIQHLSLIFRPLATAANYILDKGLKLAEMDEQSVEVIYQTLTAVQLVTGQRLSVIEFFAGERRSVVLAASLSLMGLRRMQMSKVNIPGRNTVENLYQ